MTLINKWLWITVSIFLLTAFFVRCTSKTHEVPNNHFSDEKLRIIYEFQDRRNTTALIPYLKSKKPHLREAAALSFASIKDTAALPFLYQSLYSDLDSKVKLAAAYAIGQTASPSSAGVLLKALGLELDSNVQRSIMEACGKCANDAVIEFFIRFEQTENHLQEGHALGMYRASLIKGRYHDTFSNRCLNYLSSKSSELTKDVSAQVLLRNANHLTSQQVVQLYQLVDNRNGLRNEVVEVLIRAKDKISAKPTEEIKKQNFSPNLGPQVLAIPNPYEVAKTLDELSFDFRNGGFTFLQNTVKSTEHIVVRLKAAELLYALIEPELNVLESDLSTVFKLQIDCLKSGDMGLQSAAAKSIEKYASTYVEFKSVLINQLQKTKDQLVLPRQIETHLDVDRALSALQNVLFVPLQPKYNHAIDWNHVLEIPDTQRIEIQTTKGIIKAHLFVNAAPGSVSNFLKLVEDSFYDAKYFHRVVANFVIQGGCPRGDGWGSLDWSQRSEFSNYEAYTPGTIGLASSGNDTEGVQFFITHTNTPHLDGRYTIFGRVYEGMDVVNSIAVGDQILTIRKIK
ncbi:MAG: cyclophilin family peptidyl-prolyl cis-trans isomerase [Bacteroidia bacterium]|jgi:cyclophilin family peptidyl-prolyl cis-trans isomerase